MEERGLLRNAHNQLRGGGCGTFLVIERKKGDGTMLIIDGAYADKAPVDARIKIVGLMDVKREQDQRVYGSEGMIPCLRAENNEVKILDNALEAPRYRIRKLTPRECWRLMGYTDEDFDKAKGAGVSNSQLYKQAGNAIVKQVLMGIFSRMISPK